MFLLAWLIKGCLETAYFTCEIDLSTQKKETTKNIVLSTIVTTEADLSTVNEQTTTPALPATVSAKSEDFLNTSDLKSLFKR